MAGPTTKSRDNFGHDNAGTRDLMLQHQNVINDLALDIPLSVAAATVPNATTTETDLETFTIPASKLASTNDILLFRAWGTAANNANAKSLKIYFGGSAVHTVSLTISQAGRWYAEFQVIKTGASTQRWFSQIWEQTAANAAGKGAIDMSTASVTDTSAIIVKVTGTATSNSDITAEGMTVQFIPTAAELTAAKIGSAETNAAFTS